MSEIDNLDDFLAFATRFAYLSKSQLLQDLWVVWELGFGREGVFVDVGAADGVFLSNSFLLERLGWTGLLVEPNTNFHPHLTQARRAPLVPRALWSASGLDMTLRSVNDFLELSRLEAVEEPDDHEEEGRRASFQPQATSSVSLVDLLTEHGMPARIDYLSIDIEGSEYEALKGFDFDRFRFRCITVEHNHTPMRDRLHALLEGRGYRRKWPEISGWDDWYVSREVLERAPRTASTEPAQAPYQRLHQLRTERGEAGAARALASEMLLLWPEDPTLACQVAASLLAQGAAAEAEHVITEAIDRAPTSGAAHNVRSHVLDKLGRPEEAVAAIARAVALNPEQRAWRVRHGNLLYRLGRYEESTGVLMAAVADGSEDKSALINLARACDGLGRGGEAVSYARRAVEAAPEDGASRTLLAKLQEKWD